MQLSAELRRERARWRCECRGECGVDHELEGLRLVEAGELLALEDPGRCVQRELELVLRVPVAGLFGLVLPPPRRVRLAAAHRDRSRAGEGRDDPANLVVFCQGCHLRYDDRQHVESRRATVAGVTVVDPRQVDLEDLCRKT